MFFAGEVVLDHVFLVGADVAAEIEAVLFLFLVAPVPAVEADAAFVEALVETLAAGGVGADATGCLPVGLAVGAALAADGAGSALEGLPVEAALASDGVGCALGALTAEESGGGADVEPLPPGAADEDAG